VVEAPTYIGAALVAYQEKVAVWGGHTSGGYGGLRGRRQATGLRHEISGRTWQGCTSWPAWPEMP
jgi:hypothetical protein